MDDLVEHYLVTVGQLLDQAAIGGLRVRLELADGQTAEGAPPLSQGAGDDQLSDTGYPPSIELDGSLVPLAQVRRATIRHPEDS
jgi:hypothetical protein